MFNESLFTSLSQFVAISFWASFFKEKQSEILHSYFTGLQELETFVHVFCAPNNVFTYTIVQLSFRAPQIVIRACMYANLYFAAHLQQEYKYFRVENKLNPKTAGGQFDPFPVVFLKMYVLKRGWNPRLVTFTIIISHVFPEDFIEIPLVV